MQFKTIPVLMRQSEQLQDTTLSQEALEGWKWGSGAGSHTPFQPGNEGFHHVWNPTWQIFSLKLTKQPKCCFSVDCIMLWGSLYIRKRCQVEHDEWSVTRIFMATGHKRSILSYKSNLSLSFAVESYYCFCSGHKVNLADMSLLTVLSQWPLHLWIYVHSSSSPQSSLP